MNIVSRSDHEDCKLLPIASSLDLRLVAAPALTQTISTSQVNLFFSAHPPHPIDVYIARDYRVNSVNIVKKLTYGQAASFD